MKLTPANIASASVIPNGSIIKKVDNNNFAPVSQADITALGFTPWGGWWPVDWLDGVCFWAWSTMNYRANYLWWSIGSRWINGKWCWYDDIDKMIYVSEDNAVKKYNVFWQLITTIVTSWSGGLLIWNNVTRTLYTENNCQKIDMVTGTVVGTIGNRLMDISPDWSKIATYSVVSSLWKNTARVSVYTATTLVLSSSYVYPVLPFLSASAPLDNIRSYWGTFIDNSEFVWTIYWYNANVPSDLYILQKLDITTPTATSVATLSPAYPWGEWRGMKYNIATSTIYFARYLTLSTCPTSLSTYTDISNHNPISLIYWASDWSIGLQDWWAVATIVYKGTSQKPRSTFPIQWQIAPIY